MTDYSRGYAVGQIAMRERAAAECYAESVRWQNEAGEPQPAQALCAARILSLPIEGEAERMREALTELVELKKIKRRMEANSAHPRERLRYEQGKENAWSRAEAALAATRKEEGNG